MAPPASDRPANRVEIFLGRSLAMCAHPVAAWPRARLRARLVIVAGYVAAGYVTTLTGLLLLA
jgi:hypothetical protein